jgi:glycosyltransferase involved in cell wall biosynthesis
LKALLVSYLYNAQEGGASRAVETLANYLVSQNVDVTILTTQPERGIRMENQGKIKIIRFQAPNLYWVKDKDQQPLSKKALWQLIDIWNPFVYPIVKTIIAQNKPDLVHVHKLRGLSPSVWLAVQKNGVKVIHTAHDFELISPQGTLSGRIGQSVLKRSILFRPYQYLRANASRAVCAFTAPSHFVMNLHHELGFFSNAVHKVIPNTHGFEPIPPSNHSPNREILAMGKNKFCRFLYIGRLDAEKGIDRFCNAFDVVSQQAPYIHLSIAGSGNLESILQSRYSSNPAIQFLGFVQGSAKIAALQNSDYVVVPSVCQEAFGITAIEAFFYGKPVLASRTGGLPEIVRHNENGFLIDPMNEIAWQETIQNASQASNYGTLARQAQEDANQYTLQKIGQAFGELYQHVIG